MRILVAGGSGFLGRRLAAALSEQGHDVWVLTRSPRDRGDLRWSADDRDTAWTTTLPGTDAVVNLAGTSIAGGRWTAARKAAIRDSRVHATRAIVEALDRTGTPAVLLSSSAVGYYGNRGDQPLSEDASPGSDFLAGVCRDWEAEALTSERASRVVLLRTGLVLAPDAGALPRMALPFRVGAGGRVGSGRQWMSWIHADDWVGVVCWALTNAAVAGPLNVTAPTPVTNAAFTQELARALHRPALVPAPAFALRLLLGEMADALLLSGQRVLPTKAVALGYEFRYAELGGALAALFRPKA